nr:MAG TPA: hypothetical protein [Caudoviricetes sp.]
MGGPFFKIYVASRFSGVLPPALINALSQYLQ